MRSAAMGLGGGAQQFTVAGSEGTASVIVPAPVIVSIPVAAPLAGGVGGSAEVAAAPTLADVEPAKESAAAATEPGSAAEAASAASSAVVPFTVEAPPALLAAVLAPTPLAAPLAAAVAGHPVLSAALPAAVPPPAAEVAAAAVPAVFPAVFPAVSAGGESALTGAGAGTPALGTLSCRYCLTPRVRGSLYNCTKCYNALYCNRECQSNDWREHKRVCAPLVHNLVRVPPSPPASAARADARITLASLYNGALAGNPVSMMELGACFVWGERGAPQDLIEAAKWYERGTNEYPPSADALYYLASCYNCGIGVQQDFGRAVELYQRAEELGRVTSCAVAHPPPLPAPPLPSPAPDLAEAYYASASCFFFGDGVAQNPLEAVRLFRIAAVLGHASAQYYYGVCLQTGEGVAADPVEAFTWMQRAADAGEADALCGVGLAYLCGNGVGVDKRSAIHFLHRSAAKGSPTAMYNLGVCYQDGDGVEMDPPRSVAWFNRALEAGCEKAATDIAGTPLTNEQRVEVTQLLNNHVLLEGGGGVPALMMGVGGGGSGERT